MPLQETSDYVHAWLFRLVNDCKLDMQIWEEKREQKRKNVK